MDILEQNGLMNYHVTENNSDDIMNGTLNCTLRYDIPLLIDKIIL